MDTNKGRMTKDGIRIYEPADFDGMAKAGALAAMILDEIAGHVTPGQTTGELDRLITQMVSDAGAISATIGYKGYQHASCISVNHVVCHGIPGDKVLKDGDILNIDVTVIMDGWYGDTSRMFYIGKPSIKAQKLVETTFESMWRGIEMVRPGATLGDIGHAIQSYAESKRYSVVRDFCGHGLGRVFHDAPNIMHFGRSGEGEVLREGMFFTIEPMINAGRFDVKILSDGWTAVTKDRGLSAQFEHSLAVTKDGYEVFTESPTGLNCPPYNV